MAAVAFLHQIGCCGQSNCGCNSSRGFVEDHNLRESSLNACQHLYFGAEMIANHITLCRLALGVAILCWFPASLANGKNGEPSDRTQADVNNDSASAEGPIDGFTEPYADISMAASEMGTLTELFVKEGDTVASGQLLANLDDAVLRASLAIAKAGMEAEGELTTAQTQLELKQVELKKLTELFRRNHASQQELDRVSGEVKIAEARLHSAREERAIRRLEHARIEAQLKQREIRSTIDGIVVHLAKDRGEFVSPSDPAVARIVQLNPLLIVFSVPTQHRAELAKGQQVQVRIGNHHEPASAFVEFVSPTADASSGTFLTKVRLPNENGQWHSGEKSVLLLDEPVPTFQSPERIAKQTE